MTKLMKTCRVAEVLDVSDREVRNLCERGDIRAGKVGSQWRIHPDDLEAYVRKLRGLTAPAAVADMKKGASA